MTTTKWIWCPFMDLGEDGHMTKPHLVPSSLRPALLADLRDRGSNVNHTPKVSTEFNIDEPGMIAVGRPWEDFRLPGLSISIPSEDCATFLLRLSALEGRRFANGLAYYKLHAWNRCMVLRPWHLISLEAQMKGSLASAELRARVFWADRETPAQVLRKVNAKTANVPIEQMPDYSGPSGHRVDRFQPRERGKA